MQPKRAPKARPPPPQARPIVRARQTSKFLALPAEIRNTTYEMVLTERGQVSIYNKQGFLSVCYQIRGEAWAFWYGNNKFSCIVENCHSANLQRWVDRAIKNEQIESIAVSLLIRKRYSNERKIRQATMGGGQTRFLQDALDSFSGWPNLIDWCRHIWSVKGSPRFVSSELDTSEAPS